VRKAIKTTLQKAAIHRDHRDRRRTTLSPRSGKERRIQSVTLAAWDHDDSGNIKPKSPFSTVTAFI
jgi:hypothetical protein